MLHDILYSFKCSQLLISLPLKVSASFLVSVILFVLCSVFPCSSHNIPEAHFLKVEFVNCLYDFKKFIKFAAFNIFCLFSPSNDKWYKASQASISISMPSGLLSVTFSNTDVIRSIPPFLPIYMISEKML